MTPEEFKARFPHWEYLAFEYGRWRTSHVNYDASWEGEEDGWVDNGLLCDGRTLDELAGEVEAREAELAAQGTEARRATTVEQGVVHDGPVAKPCAHTSSGGHK